MRVTRVMLPAMVARDHGHIVNISSINAVRIVPDMTAYSTSKAGVHMFTETLRGELAETAIRVTELQPGLTAPTSSRLAIAATKPRPKPISTSSNWRWSRKTWRACVVFALDQPAHVQIAEMMILPVNRY